ncbi:hypothetical protein [Peribacillus frigoritolerans]|uniref:hypothetical protein n=1 Tax=Peribacillus frigoritolerans TaxID=450367 RepID=UPI0039A1B7F9
MFGYVYITTNLINGMAYVGKHKGEFDPTYYGSGKLLRRALNKHGRESFYIQILDTADTEADLNELEIFWIDSLCCVEDARYYNIMPGGHGGLVPLTEEGLATKRLRISERVNNFYATPRGEAERERLRISKTGMKYSKEVNKKKGSPGKAHNNYGNKRGYKDDNHPKNKRMQIVLPNGEEHIFSCAKFGIKWAKENLDMGRGTLLNIIYTQQPYFTWINKKKHLIGLTATYLES